MNEYLSYLLQGIRRVNEKVGLIPTDELHYDREGQAASDLIKETLMADAPCMISRVGAAEMKTILRYEANQREGSFLEKSERYLSGESSAFWYDARLENQMSELSGFFPMSNANLDRFAKMMLAEIGNVDVWGSWVIGEKQISAYYDQAKSIRLKDLEPYYHDDPWTEVLENKKVLVIHPYSQTITKQCANREKIFKDQRMLPKFELLTYRPVHIIMGQTSEFESWFEALDKMKEDIAKIDFDIAIIAAGAYGFPLASHVKKLGKKAVHVGGSAQLMFGIKGKRWEDRPFFKALFNDHWVRPSEDEQPVGFKKVENGAYW